MRGVKPSTPAAAAGVQAVAPPEAGSRNDGMQLVQAAS